MKSELTILCLECMSLNHHRQPLRGCNDILYCPWGAAKATFQRLWRFEKQSSNKGGGAYLVFYMVSLRAVSL